MNGCCQAFVEIITVHLTLPCKEEVKESFEGHIQFILVGVYYCISYRISIIHVVLQNYSSYQSG